MTDWCEAIMFFASPIKNETGVNFRQFRLDPLGVMSL